MFQRHRGIQHKQMNLYFIFSCFFFSKLFLPIIPIGIVAYAFVGHIDYFMVGERVRFLFTTSE